MYAVIRTGGKQYRVAADEVISIEKLPGESGEQVLFEDVLLVGNGEEATIGSPLVAGATVAGEVVEQTRARKIIVFKKKRRKNYRRTQGHRQHLTLVRITEILTEGAKPSAKKAARKTPKKAEDDQPKGKSAEAPQAGAKEPEAKAKPKKAEPKQSEGKAGAAKASARKAKPKASGDQAKPETKGTAAEVAPEQRDADEAKKD